MQCTPLSGSETGPITTRLPSATDRERQGGELAASGRRSAEHPEEFARICSTSTPTDVGRFGQLALMLLPAQICLSCDELTACWIIPQITHAIG